MQGGSPYIVPDVNAESLRFEDIADTACNHTSPGTTSDASPTTSDMSLGSRIDDFIMKQRKFSDHLNASSPKSISSIDSADEIQQVFVDGDEGLVLHNPESDACDPPEGTKDARGVWKGVEARGNQKLITSFFRSALVKIREHSDADYAALLADKTGSVTTNQEQADDQPEV